MSDEQNTPRTAADEAMDLASTALSAVGDLARLGAREALRAGETLRQQAIEVAGTIHAEATAAAAPVIEAARPVLDNVSAVAKDGRDIAAATGSLVLTGAAVILATTAGAAAGLAKAIAPSDNDVGTEEKAGSMCSCGGKCDGACDCKQPCGDNCRCR